ncbi:MAG TPA: hypothetical protein VEA16_04180 [Vicinamibacterales bacterium]|nr:hypothetical protein [Vicinamibacterales bacterium]
MVLAVSGGFRTTVGGLRISARSPFPLTIATLATITLWYVNARRAHSIAADLTAAWEACQRHAAIVAIGLASLGTTATFATRSAAGADASGYISEAALLSSGRLFHVDPLADLVRGHDSFLTSPLGWRPAADGTQAPTYPPGLPLLFMVPHAIAGVGGASWVVSICGAIAVIATGLLAVEFAGGVTGLIAAVLLAFTPVFLYQGIQPMSDVPVTAAWMVCFALLCRAAPLDTAAGIACALAVLIRPNLAPLAIVPLLLSRRRIAFAVPVAIAAGVIADLQWIWYGSPLRSGYGGADELFALSNIGANASRYFAWLIATAPALLLAVFGFLRLKSNRAAQGLMAFSLLVVAAYLVYAVFDDWSYLRFLLPAVAVFAIFAAVALSAWIDRWPVSIRAVLLFVVVIAITAHGLAVARAMQTFRLADHLRRVERVAGFINEDVPPSAVIVAGEQSGSMRYYTERPIVRWEAASPEALSVVTTALEQSRRPVYIVLDAWEDGRFREKFSSVPAAALDWPPILDAGTSHRTRLWKLSDRERFLRGEQLETIRLP